MLTTDGPTTFSLGDITIHRVVESVEPFFEIRPFFPTLAEETLAENRAWLEPTYLDPATDMLLMTIQSYIVRTPHHTILIDSCVGNHKPRPNRPFWDMMRSGTWERNLAAAGFRVEDIDYVMCTHMHVDHVGWNTRLENGRWVPTFPNAKYIFAARELEYWTNQYRADPASCPPIGDSVLPVIEAKREQVVASNHVLNDLVKLVPTPGHTIDHVAVQVGKPGQDALVMGDMIHSPLQARYPGLSMRGDYDAKQSAETRRRIFNCFCETSTLMCTAHFPGPSAGRFDRDGDGFKFVRVAS